jgi:hypothetical protein
MNSLPILLRNKINAKNISKIEFFHKKSSKLYIPSLIFIKQYIPSIKYHNECAFQHIIDNTVAMPMFKVYNKEDKLVASFESSQMNPEQVLEKVLENAK